MIKVVDIFAGPGGLSEGFSAVKDKNAGSVFDIALSIEMDKSAYETLKLRAFFRAFQSEIPEDYYRYLRQEIGKEALYDNYPKITRQAASKCWHAQLGRGGQPSHIVRERIENAVKAKDDWVLIGGPPCQAYSLVGRSRNKGNPKYDPCKDIRQHLYIEYLQILSDNRPAVFIMENVKGLLSATINNNKIFQNILRDLRNPAAALKREGRLTGREHGSSYRILSLIEKRELTNGAVHGAVIKAEKYGVPQARHRVILLGIREDISYIKNYILTQKQMIPMSAAISSLPPLRSGLSRIEDSSISWEKCFRSQINSAWANSSAAKSDSPELSRWIRSTLCNMKSPHFDRGGEFVPDGTIIDYEKEWYHDSKIKGVCNHSTRQHMVEDLYRYLYAACYAKLHGISPLLKNFPSDLLPNHANVKKAIKNTRNFSDRFRVQIENQPSSTITSHISKDGHYFIHPDPLQCRSLTVREAARLQTFPDNYYFCGPRTAQYIQVGNAVPPILAREIGKVVYSILK